METLTPLNSYNFYIKAYLENKVIFEYRFEVQDIRYQRYYINWSCSDLIYDRPN